jgi:hypothetical protein
MCERDADAVGGDRLGRDAGLYEVAHLGYARKLGLHWHGRHLLYVVRRCALANRNDMIG